MSKPHWPLTRPQSRAMCLLTDDWEQVDIPYAAEVLGALEHRGCAEQSTRGWRLTPAGIREAKRFGSVAAINRGEA